MENLLYQARREALSHLFSASLNGYSKFAKRLPKIPVGKNIKSIPENPLTPEDFNPLGNECFQSPFKFYKMLRDQYPVYRLKNGVFCVSRYQDIVEVSRDTEHFSSQHQGVVANLKPNQDLLKEVEKFEFLTKLGVIPADVLATSDPPVHTTERKVGHTTLGARYVKSLEAEVENLCSDMMHELLKSNHMEFMEAFGWRLPMVLIIRLLGLPENDFEQIKRWCVEILNSQNGIQDSGELASSYASAFTFLRYCWRKYLTAKSNPGENLMGIFVKNALDPESDFTDEKAVSAIFQLIIAGSDSSATTMGNALKLLIENPDVYAALAADHSLIPAYIEEVFRLESAFQGHFRWVKKATQLQGVHLPEGSRIFLMWASGNRDERFWDQPDQLQLNRKNGKKHLTFGHGIHACLGRELARMEIRIVLKQFLTKTNNLRIIGETPYVASMFARTLIKLPIAYDVVATR